MTRDRLYLETMQQVYSNVTKVMVDSRSNSNLLYLPLDKLMQQAGGTAAPRPRRRRAAAAPQRQRRTGRTTPPRSRDGAQPRPRRPLIDDGSIRA